MGPSAITWRYSVVSSRRRWLCLWLMWLVPLYGMSPALAMVLGLAHTHLEVRAAVSVLEDFRRVDASRTSSAEHAHQHAAGERHTHADPHDAASAVALEPASETTPASPGAVAVTLASGGDPLPMPAGEGAEAWWPHEPSISVGRDPEPLEHPPKR